MDATEMKPSKEIDNSQPTPKKRGRKPKSETKQNTISKPEATPAGPPRTRSKVAPYWNTKESLILVNVVSVIEADCMKNVSSHQKWKMIVEHCVALDLQRTLNQCRSRWNSLVTEYNQIRGWDSKSKTGSFWDLDCEKRKEFQLPENFDKDLFQAIDDYARAKMNDADTDPDTDAEAETEAEAESDHLGPMAKLGSKRHKRRSISEEIMPGEKPQNICELEQPQEFQAEVEPQKSCEEVNPQMSPESETPQAQYGEEEPLGSHLEENQEVNPQMRVESETPQAQYGGEEPRGSHLEENEEVNNEIFVETETSNVKHEQELQKSHLEENEEVNHHQMCVETETSHVKFGEQEPQKSHLEENGGVNHQICVETGTSHVKHGGQEPQKSHLEEKSQESCRKENIHIINVEEEPEKSPKDKNKKTVRPRKKKTMGKELAVENLYQNAEMILAVVQGNLPERADHGVTNAKSVQESQTDLVRRQADSLISCLGNIVSILNKFPDLVHEK